MKTLLTEQTYTENRSLKIKKPQPSAQFVDMMTKHKNKMEELASSSNPYDWAYGLESLIEHLRWMRDYYELGENVCAMESTCKYSRLESIKLALSYYDKWTNSEKDFIQVIKTGEMKTHYNGNDTYTIEDMGYKCVFKYGSSKKTYRKLRKYQQKNKKLFFKTLYKYIESWWD